jgi:hypothetical protein
MTVAELDEQMSAVELTHWQAFYKVEAEKNKPKKTSDD